MICVTINDFKYKDNVIQLKIIYTGYSKCDMCRDVNGWSWLVISRS